MRIRIIDAFTERPFAGNPAGVCILDNGGRPDEAWMAKVAAELNLSETAFAYRQDRGDTHWALHWFTPAVEVGGGFMGRDFVRIDGRRFGPWARLAAGSRTVSP